ncbi:MAG: SusC/RagA family TonB-linked outer membrane protein [Bacteroidota bacterium]
MRPKVYPSILKFSSVVLALLFAVSFSYAQRTISGTVTDADNGDPLIGANVIVKGTDKGAITDFNGAYSIAVGADDKTLVFSYTGYQDQEVEIGSSDQINVNMSSGEILDEVVVIGYGTVKKKDATGSVVGVGSEDFNKGVISSPEQLIQGRAAGVQITSSSGEPGAGINVRIRGTSSVRNGNNPLFVVDGVPLSGGDASGGVQAGGSDSGFGSSSPRNPLNFLNPADIESIDILKDASATAIYGSRGANGVVLITTKKGRKDQSVLNYNVSVGVSNVSKKYDLLGANDFVAAWSSFNPTADPASINFGGSTDWQDVIFRTALTNSHNISFGGGSNEGTYRFSMGYENQQGVVENSGLRRITARFNGDRKFWDDRLKIETQVAVTDLKDDNVPITDNAGFEGDLLAAALKSNPTIPQFNADGVAQQVGPTEPNPQAILDYTRSFTNTLRGLASVTASVKIVDQLSFTSRVGYDRSISSRKDAFSGNLMANGIWDGQSEDTKKGRLFLGDVDLQNTLWENFFTYDITTDSDLSVNALLGYSYQEFRTRNNSIEMTNFRQHDLNTMLNNYAAVDARAPNSIVPTNSSFFIDELQSFYGRINLGYQSKYLLTATLRADGSTKFGEGNQYGIFPSAAFKWKIAEEGFLGNALDALDLRLNFGVTGNQEFGHNLFTDRQRYGDFDIANEGTINGGDLTQVAFQNPDLKWESTTSYGAGIDFAVADYRVTGSLDYYRKTTNDLLIQLTSAQPAPNPFVWTNLDADVINSGVELGLNVAAVTDGDFTWDINANVAYNKNKVKNLGGLIINTGAINGQGLTGAFVQRIAEDQPLYAFFLREFVGFSEDGSVQEYANGDVQEFTGDSPLPTWNVGLTNTLSYKDLSLSFFFTGQFGHSIYSNTGNAFFTAGSIAGGRNVTTDVIGNGEARTNAPDVSTRFLEKGDFLRLQNVTLSYNIAPNSDYISNIGLFVTGQNLFVITGYSGQDPEVNVNKQIDGVPSFGIDYTAYPRVRTFTFGANISF